MKTAKKATGVKLRAPQVRILSALAKAKSAMTRTEIAEAAPCDTAGCVEWIGSSDPKKRAANDKKHFPSLLSLSYVKATDDTPTSYTITAAGRKALKEAAK